MKKQKLEVVFFKTDRGNMPVKEWLNSLSKESKKIIGEDLRTAQFGFPLGMPLVRFMEKNLWEIRSHLENGSGVRIFFTICQNYMILLHSFVKKSQKTPKKELTLARKRRDKFFKKE
jgi:phage-related protein